MAFTGTPIVIDNGSDTIKCGFAGEGSPEIIFPTLIGYPKNKSDMLEKYRIGEEARQFQDFLDLKYPIHQGVVKDWESMKKIWHYVFGTKLGIDPSDHPILLTESPLNPNLNREKTCKIMFETFNIPGIYIANQALLAIYCSGRTTGLVFLFGADVSQVVPIQEGIALTYAIQKFQITGRDITRYLMKLLRQRGCFTNSNYSISSDEWQIVRDIKENFCYIALDLQKEKKLMDGSPEIEKSYSVPNGKTLTLGSERFLAPEIIFNPSILNKKDLPINESIVNAISKCDTEIHKELYLNIILSGGSTMFPGLEKRLTKEISNIAPKGVEVKVISHPSRKHMTWIGGSILASIRTLGRGLWITRQEYEKDGPSVINKYLK